MYRLIHDSKDWELWRIPNTYGHITNSQWKNIHTGQWNIRPKDEHDYIGTFECLYEIKKWLLKSVFNPGFIYEEDKELYRINYLGDYIELVGCDENNRVFLNKNNF